MIVVKNQSIKLTESFPIFWCFAVMTLNEFDQAVTWAIESSWR